MIIARNGLLDVGDEDRGLLIAVQQKTCFPRLLPHEAEQSRAGRPGHCPEFDFRSVLISVHIASDELFCLMTAFGTTSSAFVQASLHQLIAAARLPNSDD